MSPYGVTRPQWVNKQSSCWRFRTPGLSCDVSIMLWCARFCEVSKVLDLGTRVALTFEICPCTMPGWCENFNWSHGIDVIVKTKTLLSEKKWVNEEFFISIFFRPLYLGRMHFIGHVQNWRDIECHGRRKWWPKSPYDDNVECKIAYAMQTIENDDDNRFTETKLFQ